MKLFFFSESLPIWVQLIYSDFPPVSQVTGWCLKDPQDNWLNKEHVKQLSLNWDVNNRDRRNSVDSSPILSQVWEYS